MIDQILSTLQLIATPTGLVYIFGGALVGVVLGAIPGLSGGTLTILLLPITYKMNPALAIGLFTALYAGNASGGCIGSILLGIPGSNSSIVTCWDGYALTKKGDPVRALSAAVTACAIGAIPGMILAMVLSPILAEWAVKLGPWEYFALCFCAIAMVIGLSKGNLIKGLLSAGLAMLISSIGVSPISATSRFSFDNVYLSSGFEVVDLMMGFFAAQLMLIEYARNSKAQEVASIVVKRFRLPVKDILDNVGNIIRSFITGAFVGFLPGVGGSTSTVLAYATEKKLAKNKEEWGKGAVGGVIAPEVANNAGVGGELIPLIALGIPGNGAMTLFITALTIHGVSVGPLLMQNNPEIVYMIYISAIITILFGLAIEIFGMPLFPTLLKTPYHYMYPAIIIISFLGVYLSTNSMFSILVMLAACAVGVLMECAGIPLMPFMMVYILSPLLEKNLRMGLNYSDTGILEFFTRPISCIFIIVGVISLLWQILEPLLKPIFIKISGFDSKDLEV